MSTGFADVRVIVVLAVALAAVVTDLRARRIPNVLTLGAAAAAWIFAAATGGLSALGTSFLGWLVGALLFFPLFALRGMGAGDVKLVAALGAWMGPLQALWLGIFASVAGGIIALAVSFAHGYLRQAVSNVWLMLLHWRIAGPGPVAGLTLQDSRAPRLAYAVPIAIGVVCTLWLR